MVPTIYLFTALTWRTPAMTAVCSAAIASELEADIMLSG